ncbi:DUF2000 family protein [Streptomyces sp. NRRL S-1813]|uniref:DUF2000 family protein n=1 Tax=Streptomyces sp. NRRL S-1813 TaxID=1463888 RepID=UPI00099CEE6B|nr:DUF2000 family protein [Streptomyces sp. NRRL S-1813]
MTTAPSTPSATATPRTAPAAPRFDTKIAVIVREDLAVWQKLNVTAFLASGIAHASGDIMGKRYEDASGHDYLALLREPVLCYTADAGALTRTHARALSRAVPTALYDSLDLVGLAVYGPRGIVDKITKGLKLHG